MTTWFGGEEEERRHDRREEKYERRELIVLERIWEGIQLETQLLREIVALLRPPTTTLSSIKLIFSGGTMPQGPVTISVGQTVTATVVGFDQNGAPFSGTIPAPTFAIDNSAIATIDATSGVTVGVSAGVANATASLTSAEGLALSDTETVTVTAVVPVLSSIKISFD